MDVIAGIGPAVVAGRIIGRAPGMFVFRPLVTLLFVLAFAALAGLLVWLLTRRARQQVSAVALPASDSALAIARERLARGEIEPEQYVTIVEALNAPAAAASGTSPAG